MSLFDKDFVKIEDFFKQKIAREENIALCLGAGAHIIETDGTDELVDSFYEMLRTDYTVLGNSVLANRLKSQQSRPIIRWAAQSFKKYDADGSMYSLLNLPKEPKPIIIIENIADIPEAISEIYDDPVHVEDVLLHSWKNDIIHLTFKQQAFQLNRSDYTVIFPVKPGDLNRLRHSIKGEGFGIISI